MARNGSGTFSSPYPNFVSGTVISSTQVDANNSDIATALTQSIAVDGQSTVTGNIPLSTYKLTGVGAGSAATDSLTLGQAQAEAMHWCGTAGGAANAITLAPSPAITAYAAGQRFVWKASSNVNTGATTVAISGLAAIALQDNGAAFVAGNHAANKFFMGILDTATTMQVMQVQISGTDPLIVSSITGLTSINSGQIGGRRNIIYNGEMKVAQRATSATGLGAAAGYFTLDRWQINVGSTAGRFTMAQVADGPPGFANSMKFSTTTADTSIAAGEVFFLRQLLEGQDLQQLKKGTASSEQVTVSFWVKGNASATYVCELEDHDNSRVIGQSFAVTTSWNRIELTFAADTSDPLNDDNAVSFAVNFWLHAGSTYTGGTFSSNTWADIVQANRAVGISSIFDATSRTLFITGVQMEIGATATEFEHRTFGEELALCQRYYEKSYDYIVALGTATYNGMHVAGGDNIDPHTSFISGNFVEYTQRKRAAATVVFYDQAGTAGVAMRWQLGVSNTNGQNITMSGNSVRGIFTYSSGTASATGLEFHFTASAEL